MTGKEELDEIYFRTLKLADLLVALADQATTREVRSGALQIAADYAGETATRMSVVLDREG